MQAIINTSNQSSSIPWNYQFSCYN